MKKYWFIALALLVLFSLNAQAISLDEILENYEESVVIPHITTTLTVQLISAKGEVREIRAKAYQQSKTESEANRLFLFEYPPSVRDTGILINSFKDVEKSTMWMYLPAVKRVKRIALATSGGGYFMGSDFSYSDFIPKSRDDFYQEYLGEEYVDGTLCYKVKESTKTDTQRQNLKLSYMINFYRASDYVMFARDYYDLAGEKVKEYRVKAAELLGGKYMYPTRIVMENIQTGHKSVLQMSEISLEAIPDSYFTKRFLENR